MNWEHVSANWDQMKGTLRAKWGRLTEDDIELIKGKREILLGKLRERYADNKEKKDFDREVETWLRQLH